MKKIIASMLLVVLIFNFIFLNKPCYASEDTTSGIGLDAPIEIDSKTYDRILNEGAEVTKEGNEVEESTAFSSFGTSIIGFILGILSTLINAVIALEIDLVIAQLTHTEENGELRYFITIDRIIFNRIPILNANYFNTKDSYTVGDLEFKIDNNNKTIKESISRLYYLCRILALILGLAILVYIGIRMAISTIASDQAKYKKMLIGWFESVVIIFAMPYIISAFFIIEEALMSVFYSLKEIIVSTENVFENTMRSTVFNKIGSASGIDLAQWSIIYWVLLYTEIKFLWTYTKRFFMIGFLIAISPLVTITYSIDKVGDGRAQAFSNWIKEFTLNVLIQPLHALLYLVIVVTANNIAGKSPVVAIALLLSVGTVERMVRVVFNINDTATFEGIRDRLLKKGK